MKPRPCRGPPLRKALPILVLCLPLSANLASHGEDAVVAIGKQRAGASSLEWDVRDVTHPLLGSIKAAVQRRAVATAVGNEKILSSAFVSCQKGPGKIAIELANASESDARGGLGPTDLPRLVCSRPRSPGDGILVKSDLAASWEIGALGDTLARGLSPAALRQCVSIEIVQNLALPPEWPQKSQRVAMELAPYSRELDAIFAACGEATAFAAEEPPAPVQARVERAPPPKEDQAARPAEAPWKFAHTVAKGRTNVRSAAGTDATAVIMLDPGTKILVQQASGDWWKVKPRSGAAFGGYVRRDRFALE
jgi:hypothetical protein